MVEKNIDFIQCLMQKITHSLIKFHCNTARSSMCEARFKNELNKKLQGNGQIVLMMFENIKIFMTKHDIFDKDLEMKIMKYFPQLQNHFQKTLIFENTREIQKNAIKKYLSKLLKRDLINLKVWKIHFNLFYIHTKQNS